MDHRHFFYFLPTKETTIDLIVLVNIMPGLLVTHSSLGPYYSAKSEKSANDAIGQNFSATKSMRQNA